MINRVSRKSLEKKIAQLKHYKVPYRMEYTNERVVIHADGVWGSWMNKESSFKANELSFIKGVKAGIIKSGTYKRVRNNFKKKGSEKKIKYFYYNKKLKPGDLINDLHEIDVKNAYWRTAFLPPLGLFDEYVYEKGLTVSKKSRLAAIGSLAKTKGVIFFDGEQETEGEPMRSEKTEFLWNTISYKIGKLMAKASRIAGNDFLFFWVDAIFVRGESVKDITKLFKAAGYESSVHKCEWARFEDRKIVVKSTEKAKWVVYKEEVEYIENGKKYIKRSKRREYKDERPFPYKSALTEKDILDLSNEAQ